MSEPSAAAGVRESRERLRLHVPPLLVPGERASYLFGIGGGCLPMLIGVAAWLLFWFGGDEPPTGMRKWGTLGFSSVFFLMGLRFAMETFWPPRGRLDAVDSAPEGWGEGYPWQREMPPYDAGTGPGKIVAAFVGLTLFLVVINFPLFDRQTDTILWVLILFFDAFLLFVLGAVLREVLGRLNTGSVRLHLDTYPAAPGGVLRATLVSRRPLRLTGPVPPCSAAPRRSAGSRARSATPTAPAGWRPSTPRNGRCSPRPIAASASTSSSPSRPTCPAPA